MRPGGDAACCVSTRIFALRALLFLRDFLRGSLWLVADTNLILALILNGALRALLLAFHLCQALLERVHQIHYRRSLLRLLHTDDMLAFEVSLDQLFDVGFEGVVIRLLLQVRVEPLHYLM